jgi:uncharacterized membrane protein HdeD (DUF308 family)
MQRQRDPLPKTSQIGFSERGFARHSWDFHLGLVLILLGSTALFSTKGATLSRVMLFGWLVVVSGIVEAVHASYVRRSDEFSLHLVPLIASVPVGLLIAIYPPDKLPWMMMFAAFFIVVGLFRLALALRFRFPNWHWILFDGAVTALLGILLWAVWPWWEHWFAGITVGIALIVRGWSTIMLAEGRRQMRSPGNAPSGPSEEVGPHRSWRRAKPASY